MSELVEVQVNERRLKVPAGTSVAAAVFLAGETRFRTSVSGEPRAALCGMGICFECRVTIDDQPHCRSCQTTVQSGMSIQTS
ncbi:MAG TPA: (2Fe-2S)-binding protein [Bryobacteraceae bacterium]|nr:(2Fe-2S)-binding protein [Bryobacteraceae bacterium]